LSIVCLKDRVVQTAMLLVLQPIFETDLLPEQYEFRPGLDAKVAIRRVYYHITEFNHTEIVDADLQDYFTSIPHGSLIKRWLEVPTEERTHRGIRCRSDAKDRHSGVAQGSPLSPLWSNCYFRRFLLAWKSFGIEKKLDARVVNYSGDFVICCKPQTAEEAMCYMRKIMGRIGLTINETKTRIVKLPQERFDFLGYTLGRCYRKDNSPYIGSRPSKKAVKKIIHKIHDKTNIRMTWTTAEDRVLELNKAIRGWCNYFNQGPVLDSYKIVRKYTEKRLRRWLVKKNKLEGTTVYRQFPDKYLY
jgi:RNA-directed DNA polymerase